MHINFPPIIHKVIKIVQNFQGEIFVGEISPQTLPDNSLPHPMKITFYHEMSEIGKSTKNLSHDNYVNHNKAKTISR